MATDWVYQTRWFKGGEEAEQVGSRTTVSIMRAVREKAKFACLGANPRCDRVVCSGQEIDSQGTTTSKWKANVWEEGAALGQSSETELTSTRMQSSPSPAS